MTDVHSRVAIAATALLRPQAFDTFLRQRAGVTASGRQMSTFALDQAAIFGSQLPQNRFEAIAAPSLSTANFAQTTSGSTPPDPA